MTRYPLFDRRDVNLQPVQDRGHDLLARKVASLQKPAIPYLHPQYFQELAIGIGGRMVFLENDFGNRGSFPGGDTCVHGRTIS